MPDNLIPHIAGWFEGFSLLLCVTEVSLSAHLGRRDHFDARCNVKVNPLGKKGEVPKCQSGGLPRFQRPYDNRARAPHKKSA